MSRLFGELRQLGIVVRDIEAAMCHLVEVSASGPGSTPIASPVTGFTYGDRRCDDVRISIALANSGDVHLKLIQQRRELPT